MSAIEGWRLAIMRETPSIRQALEIAWDEGHDEARHGTAVEDNPYREELS
jgi:hypothetical protein